MNSIHHSLNLVPARVTGALKRLAEQVWIERRPLVVEATAAVSAPILLEAARSLPRVQVNPGEHWGHLFDQRWYRLNVPTPADGLWLHWDEQSEATLYSDGRPFYGFDVAHRYCRLPRDCTDLWMESNCLQSAIWHPSVERMKPQGARFSKAETVQRDDAAWEAYHDLSCLCDLMLTWRRIAHPELGREPPLVGLQSKVESYPPEYRQLLRLLDLALDRWETEGRAALIEGLKKAYAHVRTKTAFLNCVLTGHAHIDLVWIWPERVGELKAVHTFASMNRLLEEYPEFRFAYSQPASYEAVGRRSPELLEEVRKKIKSGVWQATGALYVESDTMMPCGEALARSFEIGQAGFREIAGAPSKIVWLPDVFGYSACLPQLMRHYGISGFFTTKMTWNAVNRFPYSSFRWRSHDGSEVLAHVTQDFGYNSTVEIEEVRKAAYGHQQADVHGEFLMPTGYGDGGGGVTPEMCERARRLDGLASLPRVNWDHPEAFFQRMEPLREQLPVHEGECYLEYHRGTFTTHRRVKELFRATERALQTSEAVALQKGNGPDLSAPWKRLVFTQFHDYIPGSSVWDVYEEGNPEFEALVETLEGATHALLEDKPGEPALFNPHARPIRVYLPESGGMAELPPLSGSPLATLSCWPVDEVVLDGQSARNGLVSFTLDANGWVSHLAWEDEDAEIGAGFGALTLAPDRAANFEAWDIDRHVACLAKQCAAPCQIEAFRRADGATGFAVSRSVGHSSGALVRFFLLPGSHELHMEMELNWKDPETLLKLSFPTRYRGKQARFGAPFGSVLRSQIADGAASEAQWEVPFSRWLAVADDVEREGLCIVTESSYGASVRDGEVAISLVRSPRITGREMHAGAWPAELSRLKDAPVYSDLGLHGLRMAVGKHSAALPFERQAPALADALFSKPVAYSGPSLEAPFRIGGHDSNVVPCWAKPMAGGGLIRVHETSGCRGKIEFQTSEGWQLARSNFEGEALGEWQSHLCLCLKAHEIGTICLRRV